MPSSLALAQGLGKNPGCHNVSYFNASTNETDYRLEPIKIVPNFSVQVYFFLMFVLLIICTCSFSFLNFSKIAIRARKPNAISNKRTVQITPSFEESLINDRHKVSISSEGTLTSNLSTNDSSTADRPLRQLDFDEKRELLILFSLIFMLSFICYGILPGLQPYSTLPYGNDIYNYSVNFSEYFFKEKHHKNRLT